MLSSTLIRSLPAPWITTAAFQPFGQVITPRLIHQPHPVLEAQLHLEQGIPRFYLMRLLSNGRRFSKITRHQYCTQCLGSLADKDWWIAVAPPAIAAQPDLEAISAFRIPGNCFIKLNLGTWHAGPYFEHEFVDFYNLELQDTNLNDHETFDLAAEFGCWFEIR